MVPPAPPNASVRCFSTKLFASTKDELRRDLRNLQVQLQKSQARRVQLEQELAEAKQMAVITRQHFLESQDQYQQLKTEVETIQASGECDREESQVTVLHSQRTVLAQRVLQLLGQNGKLQATSVKLRHQIEQQDAKIQQLEQELFQLQNSEASVMTQNTIATSSCSCKDLSSPSSKQGSNQVKHAGSDAPSGSHQASLLEQRIKDLESQNRLLLDQQEQNKQHWDQERDRMQQYMTVLKQKALELETSKKLYRSESPQKRDFPPFTISCDDDETQDKDQLSLVTHSTCSVTHASRSSWTSPSAYLALQGRLQQIEAQLREKEAIEVALTKQVDELRQSAQEERQRAESAEERVQSLRAYLNTSWSKQRGTPQSSSFHDMMLDMSAADPTHTVSNQEGQRYVQSLQTGNVHHEMSNPSDHPSLKEHVSASEVETTGETKTAVDEVFQLNERFHALEQKCYTLRTENAQLQHRLDQKCQENSELEDLVGRLKSRNGDGAETIFALLRHVEKAAEMDANQKVLNRKVEDLSTERDDLKNRLLVTQQRLANAEDHIQELTDLNERLNMAAAASTSIASQKSLQERLDSQGRELNAYKARYDELENETAQKEETVHQLQDQNEWLLAEIATLSQKYADLSVKLASAREEIETLNEQLQANERNPEGPETKQRSTITVSDNEGSQEQPTSLENSEQTELLLKTANALETSLKEANEQRRELEVILAATRLNLEIAQAKIKDLSNGRATAHVDVSTNPTSIDGRLQIYQLEKENQSLSRTCEEKEKQLDQALMQCNQHEQMLETVTVQVLELQLQINELEEGKLELMKESEAQLEASNAYAKDLERRIDQLQCEIVSQESERDGLLAQVVSQRAWIETTASKLNQMEGALQTCQEELESSKLRVKDLEGKIHQHDKEAASCANEEDVVDVELTTSSDDQLESRAPNHGKRTLKEIFSFGRKAV